MSNTSLLGSYGGLGNSGLQFRNRIINGDMRIDQRNAGASVTPGNGQYTLDRWQSVASQTSKYLIQRSSVAPSGFTNSLLVTSLSAYSVGASESFRVQQTIEGFNVADLDWGTSTAKSITISFWARSSLTGTFGGAVFDSVSAYSFPFSYSISAANTWEYKTVSVSGPTSGTWNKDNTGGLTMVFSLGAGANISAAAGSWASGTYVSATGATSVVGTNGATLYITGVQLEAGPVATPFEHRPYGLELSLCQRYFEIVIGASQGVSLFPLSTDFIRNTFPFKVTKRTTAVQMAGGTSSAEGGNGSWAFTLSASENFWGISAYTGAAAIRPGLAGPVTASAEL